METANRPSVKTIIYFVNGEGKATEQHKLSVRTILETAGFMPAENYTLVRDEGNHRFTDLNEEVPIHKDERFTAIYNGPTPVSQAGR
jgi:phenylalanyl-tRNA synthetase beta subunit